MKLISIYPPSNKPFHFRRLVENLVTTAADPTCFEIVVKIDIGDTAMGEVVKAIREDFQVNLKVVVSERPASYFHTYTACNEALKASDPEYYFCWHTNDEILIETKQWDRKSQDILHFPRSHFPPQGQYEEDVFQLLRYSRGVPVRRLSNRAAQVAGERE